MKSRLSRKAQRQSLKTLIFSLFGIIAVIIVVIKFGIPLLVATTYMLSGASNSKSEEKKSEIFVSVPMLDIPFVATNSAKINISGTSTKGYQIKLYVNDAVVDTVKVDSDNIFSFEEVLLEDGDNIIQAKAITKDKDESKLTESVKISYLHKEPNLSIESPSNGQTYPKEEATARVSGQTDQGVKITINGLWAIVNPDGKFSYLLPLHTGENIIKITADDGAGNKKEEERKVTLSQ
ncbi:MAG: hypothetical protein AAB907_01785 [Patescibacteria group bacterium]